VIRTRLRTDRSRVRNWITLAGLVVVLAIGVVSGRQLFMDGAYFVIQCLLDPLWTVDNQPTPRRIFANLWLTLPVRLVSLISDDAIELASVLFGLAAFLQILVPVAFILFSGLDPMARSVLLIVFLSAFIVGGQFIVSESFFSLALTTVFVVCTLDGPLDRSGIIRLIAAILLLGSYEIVAVSNLLLAASLLVARKAGESDGRRWLLVGALLAGPVFQVVFYWLNPLPSASGAITAYTLAICAALVLGLAVGLAFFAVALRAPWLCQAAILAALAAPVAVAATPELIWVKTALFQKAHPSRLYTALVICFVAALPLLAALGRIAPWIAPLRRRLVAPLRHMSAAMLALFCGVSLLTSAEAFKFRRALADAMSDLAGVVDVARCEFCRNPAAFKVADLSPPKQPERSWYWSTYSMAHAMHRRAGSIALIDDEAVFGRAPGDRLNNAVASESVPIQRWWSHLQHRRGKRQDMSPATDPAGRDGSVPDDVGRIEGEHRMPFVQTTSDQVK
jgi:hypothetical protein